LIPLKRSQTHEFRAVQKSRISTQRLLSERERGGAGGHCFGRIVP
jgi:hypothetical protein